MHSLCYKYAVSAASTWSRRRRGVRAQGWRTIVAFDQVARSVRCRLHESTQTLVTIKRMKNGLQVTVCDNIYMTGECPGKITRQLSRTFQTSNTNLNTSQTSVQTFISELLHLIKASQFACLLMYIAVLYLSRIFLAIFHKDIDRENGNHGTSPH